MNTEVTPIAKLAMRRRAAVVGTVTRTRLRQDPGPIFEAVVEDQTGFLTAEWLGRREIPGVRIGVRLRLEGTPRPHHGHCCMLNPLWKFAEQTVTHLRPVDEQPRG